MADFALSYLFYLQVKLEGSAIFLYSPLMNLLTSHHSFNNFSLLRSLKCQPGG
jgi:hypothetical protein